MRTVSLAILSSFIATFLMVQKKNLSEAGRRKNLRNMNLTFNKEISQKKNQDRNSLRPRNTKDH